MDITNLADDLIKKYGKDGAAKIVGQKILVLRRNIRAKAIVGNIVKIQESAEIRIGGALSGAKVELSEGDYRFVLQECRINARDAGRYIYKYEQAQTGETDR